MTKRCKTFLKNLSDNKLFPTTHSEREVHLMIAKALRWAKRLRSNLTVAEWHDTIWEVIQELERD